MDGVPMMGFLAMVELTFPPEVGRPTPLA